MARRSKPRYGIQDIADFTGLKYRTVLRHEDKKLFVYDDFESVVLYCLDRKISNG